MKLPIFPLSQRDTRWATNKLGFSDVTIGKSGCMLTCHSMLLQYFGHAYFPDGLNEVYKSKNVYVDLNLIDYWRASGTFPGFKSVDNGFIQCPDTPAPLEIIDQYLERRLPVIVLVDFDKATQGMQSHFVLIIGKENGSYYCNDPWTGETYFFEAKYGDPSQGIYGLRLYEGTVPAEEDGLYWVYYKGAKLTPPYEQNPQDIITDLKGQLDTVHGQLEVKTVEANDYRTKLERQTSDNQDLGRQLIEARRERDDWRTMASIAADILKLDVTDSIAIRLSALAVKDRLEAVQSLTEANTKLTSKVATLQEKVDEGIRKFTRWELLKELLRRTRR